MMSLFLSFLGLKFCTNVKNKYEKRILFDHFFYRKNSLDLPKKIKFMLQHFTIGFGLVAKKI
jgi:hypothetical protein